MAHIVWTDEARHWLQKIYDDIAEDIEEAAYRTVTAIHQRADILLEFPQIGYRYREQPDVRVLLYGHYRIAYLIARDQSIEVLGVFHGAFDMARYFTSGDERS